MTHHVRWRDDQFPREEEYRISSTEALPYIRYAQLLQTSKCTVECVDGFTKIRLLRLETSTVDLGQWLVHGVVDIGMRRLVEYTLLERGTHRAVQ